MGLLTQGERDGKGGGFRERERALPTRRTKMGTGRRRRAPATRRRRRRRPVVVCTALSLSRARAPRSRARRSDGSRAFAARRRGQPEWWRARGAGAERACSLSASSLPRPTNCWRDRCSAHSLGNTVRAHHSSKTAPGTAGPRARRSRPRPRPRRAKRRTTKTWRAQREENRDRAQLSLLSLLARRKSCLCGFRPPRLLERREEVHPRLCVPIAGGMTNGGEGGKGGRS